MSATIKKRGAAAAALSEDRPVKVGDSRNNNKNGITVIEARSLDEIKKELLALKSSSSRRRASPVVVVVRSSIPDERAKSLLPEGTVVLVPVDFGTKEPAVRSAVAASTNAPPAAKKLKSAKGDDDDDDDTGRHDLVVSRWATMRGVANEQKKNEAIRHSCWSFLAAASVDKPVMSALFRDNDPRYPQNYFQRSNPTPPRDQLRSFTYLPLSSSARGDASDAAVTTWTQRDDGGGGGPPPALDDKLVLEATFKADPDGAKRQVRRVVLLYDAAVFDRDVVDAFQANYDKALQDKKLEWVDVTVEVLNKPAYVTNLMVIVVTASSTTRRHDDALEALFPNLLRIGQQSALLIDPIDIYQMGTPMADRHGAFNLPSRESGGTMKVSAAEGFFSWLKVAALAAASSPENPNLQAFFRLAKDDGEIYANVVVFEAE
jgi:hypothetical protein